MQRPTHQELLQQVQKLEVDLEQNRQFLNNILNYIPDLVFVKDQQHRWVLLNDAFCQAFGYSREFLIGKSDYDIVSKEQADVFWEKDNLVFASGGTNINEEEFTDASGQLRTILTSKAAFTDTSGQQYLIGIAHDITEQKRVQHALADSERRLADIIEFLPDPVWVINLDGRVAAWNRAIEKMTGVHKAMILGKGAYAHGQAIYGEARPMLIDLVLQRDEHWEKQFLGFREKEGQLQGCSFVSSLGADGLYLECTAAKLYDSDGCVTGAIASIRDITARQKAEQEREQLIAELQETIANVRVLRKLLPVCASCKKVRDDEGYWGRLESYFSKHSEIDFTHGMCPECMDRLYGSEEWYSSKKY